MADKGYEIHSILEFGDIPSEGLWWVLSPSGKSPSIRAGAGSLAKRGDQNFHTSIMFSGGATPAGFVNEVNELDLIKGEWRALHNKGFQPRYEHAMCLDEENNFMVLLGAGNDADISTQKLKHDTWEKTQINISPRTVSQQANSGNKIFIWSGGSISGVVNANCLFIVENGVVSKENLCGEIPCPRQEFAMCADEKFLYIHGGINGNGLKLDDLYKINLKTFRSKRTHIEGESLVRAMHKMVVHNNALYIFGGLCKSDAISNDLYKLSPVEGRQACTQQLIDFETKPTPRIAFNFHAIDFPTRITKHATEPVPTDDTTTPPTIRAIDDWKVTIDGENVSMPEDASIGGVTSDLDSVFLGEYQSVPLLFIHGGCDSEGEFFNDIFVSPIP